MITKVVWRKLSESDLLQLGDFFSSHDPNTPERQGETGYNLQMQAVHPSEFGLFSKETECQSGRGHYRPIGISKTEIIMA
jgi:hypothetical protein